VTEPLTAPVDPGSGSLDDPPFGTLITVTVRCFGPHETGLTPAPARSPDCAREFAVTKPWRDWPATTDGILTVVAVAAEVAGWFQSSVDGSEYDLCEPCIAAMVAVDDLAGVPS
jgi:hypothetical protein